MNTNAPGQKQDNRLVQGYTRLAELAKSLIAKTSHGAGMRLHDAYAKAKEELAEVGELTREEVDTVANYLQRDVHDAAEYIVEQERELGDWLRLDLLLIEQKFLDTFGELVDKSKVEWEQLRQRANLYGEWHSGEVTSAGTLRCTKCGHLVHLHGVGHVPPCAKCHGTVFKRAPAGDE